MDTITRKFESAYANIQVWVPMLDFSVRARDFMSNRVLKRLLVYLLASLCLTLSLVFILHLNVDRIFAQDYKVGVESGDWIEYDLNWTRPPPNQYPIRIKRKVLTVDGPTITVEVMQELSDGTIEIDNRTGNIINGNGTAAMVFIPSDSKPGDIIFIEGFDPVRINGSDQRSYLGTYRTVLWAQFYSKGFDVLIFWDKETGVALEIFHEASFTMGITQVIGTNLWTHDSQSENNYLGLIVLTLIIIFMIAFAVKHIYSKKKPS